MSHQVTVGPPIREKPGFGCPGCSKPIDFKDRRGIARGRMDCCGYVPTAEETARWLAAAKALDERTGDWMTAPVLRPRPVGFTWRPKSESAPGPLER